jgi:simple sugar transport system permease protein
MMLDRLTSLALSSLSCAAPLALAAIGTLATEESGSLSISIEGCMIVGAFAAAVSAQAGAGLVTGLAAGATAGLGLSCLVGGASLALGADVFVAGLAANILAPGLVSVLSQAAFGTKGVLAAESLRSGPWPILFALSLLCLLLILLLTRSVFGLRLRASGSSESRATGKEIAQAAGISSRRYRFSAHLIAGAAAGVAGASLAAGVGAYVPGMTTGRGWIALVAVFLGGRRAWPVFLSCLVFGFLIALANLGQSFWNGGDGGGNAVELLQALPYIATAVALIAWRRLEKAKEERV